VLSLVSGAVLGIYSSGLTLITLGVRIPRPTAAFLDGAILTAGTIYVVFVAENFLGPFQSFLITLGVPLAAWAGIMIADIALRRRDYDDAALFDRTGRYGAVDLASLSIMTVATVVGWGLVVNLFSEEASWNNWQGYLLGPLGLGGREGEWAFANLGVLASLAIGFAASLVVRRGRVARQEA
jgi:purine-cytosine permease-like protein